MTLSVVILQIQYFILCLIVYFQEPIFKVMYLVANPPLDQIITVRVCVYLQRLELVFHTFPTRLMKLARFYLLI